MSIGKVSWEFFMELYANKEPLFFRMKMSYEKWNIIWKCCHTSGEKVWALYGYDMAQGYPKSLSMFNLPKKVEKIDAVLYDETSYKILFFVGSQVYRSVNQSNRVSLLVFFKNLQVTRIYFVQLWWANTQNGERLS